MVGIEYSRCLQLSCEEFIEAFVATGFIKLTHIKPQKCNIGVIDKYLNGFKKLRIGKFAKERRDNRCIMLRHNKTFNDK